MKECLTPNVVWRAVDIFLDFQKEEIGNRFYGSTYSYGFFSQSKSSFKSARDFPNCFAWTMII